MRSYVDIKDFDPKFNKQTPYTFDGKEPSTRSNYYGGKTNSKDHVMPDEATKALRRAYYACVSHSDHELGRLPPCCARYLCSFCKAYNHHACSRVCLVVLVFASHPPVCPTRSPII